jgi:D-sedoheptulose 7-phosphate isomerase
LTVQSLELPDRLADLYFDFLGTLWRRVEATNTSGKRLSLGDALGQFRDKALATAAYGHKTMFIGNGGSAGIASHMAIDYSKNGNVPSLAFNDGASLTCIGNDLGYENVFAKQISLHGKKGDLLVAISSSGRSANILNAVEEARKCGCDIITLSGFTGENPLRTRGDLNFYVPSREYGFVEITHLSLCHAALDFACGWTRPLPFAEDVKQGSGRLPLGSGERLKRQHRTQPWPKS